MEVHLYGRGRQTTTQGFNFTNISHFTSIFFGQKLLKQFFLYMHINFIVFWRKNMGAKKAHYK